LNDQVSGMVVTAQTYKESLCLETNGNFSFCSFVNDVIDVITEIE